MKLPKPLPGLEGKDRVDAALHDLANAIAASRSYGEVLHMKAEARAPPDPATVNALLKELERASDLLEKVRRDTFRPGDVLGCRDCGHEFVHRKTTGRQATCRRCNSTRVERWTRK